MAAPYRQSRPIRAGSDCCSRMICCSPTYRSPTISRSGCRRPSGPGQAPGTDHRSARRCGSRAFGDRSATLSGGQRARVACMRTLLAEPEALLLMSRSRALMSPSANGSGILCSRDPGRGICLACWSLATRGRRRSRRPNHHPSATDAAANTPNLARMSGISADT